MSRFLPYSKCRLLNSDDSMEMLWTTGAERPGLLFAGALIEPIGRKATMAVPLIVASLCFVLQVCSEIQEGT